MASQLFACDLTSQTFMHNPFPELARIRHAGPVLRVHLPLLGKVWLVTTHEAVTECLKDARSFVRNPKNAGKTYIPGLRWWMPRIIRVLAENMLGHDDPDHRRLRHLVDQAFTRQSVESMRGRIGSICDNLLDRVPAGASIDLMAAYARPLPLAVISELLGLPEQDRAYFSHTARTMMSFNSLLGFFTVLPAMYRMTSYFRRHFEQVRKRPREGLMTALVQAEQDGDKLSENELVAMAFLLLLAGHETTVHLISGGLLALLQHPDQKARLLADWSLAPSAVEELLRFVNVAMLTKARYVANDRTFHGASLKRGELIIPLLASANADPARFDQPERLDITRDPNPHVALGSGMHFCLGAQLARVETQIALQRLFTRFPTLALAAPARSLKYVGRVGIRALTALPVRAA